MKDNAIKNGLSAAFMQPGNDGGVWDAGMSKREYFAAMAMQGLIQAGKLLGSTDICSTAVIFADALLLELEKTAQ